MDRVEVRDLHAHYLAPAAIERIRAGEFAGVTADDSDGRLRFSFPTSRSRQLMDRMAGLDDRIAHLDACAIDIQVLSTWIDMFGYDLAEDVAMAYHTAINEGLAAAVDRHPDRLRFYASVPLPWGQASAEVLEDAVTRLGAVGSMIGTNINRRYFDEAVGLDPFWATSERLGVPVQLHPVDPAGSDRLVDQLDNFLGNPFDTTVAAVSLIFNGVLDRFPALRLVLVHGGGYLPYALGRVTHGRAARGVVTTLAQPPQAYLDRFVVDTIVYDPAVLRALVGLVGADHLVLGTDYPFDMEPPHVVETVRDVLGDAALQQISATACSLSCTPAARLGEGARSPAIS